MWERVCWEGGERRQQRLCGIPANQKLAPFITGTRGFPQPSCALTGVAGRRQTEEARERLGRRVLQTRRASGISEWAGRSASLLGSWWGVVSRSGGAGSELLWPICPHWGCPGSSGLTPKTTGVRMYIWGHLQLGKRVSLWPGQPRAEAITSAGPRGHLDSPLPHPYGRVALGKPHGQWFL